MGSDEMAGLKERVFGLAGDARGMQIAAPPTSGSAETAFETKDIGTGRFTLDEVLEWMARQQQELGAVPVFRDTAGRQQGGSLDSSFFLQDELVTNRPRFLLYEAGEGTYYVYSRRGKEPHDETAAKAPEKGREAEAMPPAPYVPTGVTVRMVSQDVLGTGVLGRAFIHLNYIEILDSLFGIEYFEVLTHEVLHIRFPDKSEMHIRMMTRDYFSNPRYS